MQYQVIQMNAPPEPVNERRQERGMLRFGDIYLQTVGLLYVARSREEALSGLESSLLGTLADHNVYVYPKGEESPKRGYYAAVVAKPLSKEKVEEEEERVWSQTMAQIAKHTHEKKKQWSRPT